MRIRLAVILLFATAFSAAAQFPVKTVTQYPSVLPPAEIHFVDGNVGYYPVKRISNDLIRVDNGDSQSFRMPLTFVKSIQFKDGCTLFFENGAFQFDQLVQPARIEHDSGEALLEGVLKLSDTQAKALMGTDYYNEFRKNVRLFRIGLGTTALGTALVIPYGMSAVLNGLGKPVIFGSFIDMSTSWKVITVSGGCLLIGGLVMTLIGNSGCNRVAASYNGGLGITYSF